MEAGLPRMVLAYRCMAPGINLFPYFGATLEAWPAIDSSWQNSQHDLACTQLRFKSGGFGKGVGRFVL